MYKIVYLVTAVFSIIFSFFTWLLGQKLGADSKNFRAKVANAIANQEWPEVLVLIPARNEQENIADCVRSILEQNYPNLKLLVVNDNSTDQTGQLLAELARKYDNLMILDNPPVSPGWLGKTNALWQGYLSVKEDFDLILFLDADTRLLPVGLKKAVYYLQAEKLDLLSIAPTPMKQYLHFWNSTLLLEIVTFYGLAGINPLNPAKPGSVEEATAIGAFILTSKQAYEAVGGHQAVKDEIIEDVELAKQYRAKGFKTLLVGQSDCAEAVWYPTFNEIWQGCSKNLFWVAHESLAVATVVIALEWLHKLVPLANLIFLLRQKKPSKLALSLNLTAIGVLLVTTVRANSSLGIKTLYTVLYPIAVLVATAIMVNSAARKYIWRSVKWKNRTLQV